MDDPDKAEPAQKWTLVNKKPKSEQHDADGDGPSASPERDNRGSDEKLTPEGEDDEVAIISEEEIDINKLNSQLQEGAITSSNPAKTNEQPFIPNATPNLTNSYYDMDYPFTSGKEELCDDFYACDNKVRSYIHKRNNKLSGMLNTILLGTILITACLALGHVWGTTDDCSPEMSSSLSELLYAMQELQHENYVLKARIKTLEARKNSMSLFSHRLYKMDDINAKQNTDDNIDMKKDSIPCQCADNSNTQSLIDDVKVNAASINDFNTSDIQAIQFDVVQNDDLTAAEDKLIEDVLLKEMDIGSPKFKRSIGDTASNSFIGPKTLAEHLNESPKKYKSKLRKFAGFYDNPKMGDDMHVPREIYKKRNQLGDVQDYRNDSYKNKEHKKYERKKSRLYHETPYGPKYQQDKAMEFQNDFYDDRRYTRKNQYAQYNSDRVKYNKKYKSEKKSYSKKRF